jgi:uncharacterized coiled-coil DUF342 family protein
MKFSFHRKWRRYNLKAGGIYLVNLDEIYNKLDKLWSYLDEMPVDKSKEEMNDLIVDAMEQIEEIKEDVENVQIELEEMNIKLQNIIRSC